MSLRKTLLLVGTFAFIGLTACVFAYIQQAEAKRQAALAAECARQSIEMRQQLEASKQQAQREVDRALAALQRAEEMKVSGD